MTPSIMRQERALFSWREPAIDLSAGSFMLHCNIGPKKSGYKIRKVAFCPMKETLVIRDMNVESYRKHSAV